MASENLDIIQFPLNKGGSEEKDGIILARQIKFSIWKATPLVNNITSALGDIANSGDSTVKKFENEGNIKRETITATNAAKKADLRSTIILPLPNTLRDSQNHTWAVKEGMIGTIVNSLTGESIGSMIAGDENAKKPMGTGKIGIISKVLGVVQNQVSKRLRDVSIDQMLGSVSAMTGLRKPLGDPGYFQNYTGSSPREFTMSWDLMPKNARDAQRIFEIVKSFKHYASPSTGIPGVTLLAPHFFTLEITNQWLHDMLSPGHMVIKDISVDYAPDGSFNLYDSGLEDGGGFPKMINLSLALADVIMRTAEDYSEKLD